MPNIHYKLSFTQWLIDLFKINHLLTFPFSKRKKCKQNNLRFVLAPVLCNYCCSLETISWLWWGSIAKESHGHPCGESTETETGRGDSEVGGRFWNHSRHLTEW